MNHECRDLRIDHDDHDFIASEIYGHMTEIKTEWRETVSRIGQVHAPEGLNKTDVVEWKLKQARLVKERLVQLEERLKRLQILDAQVKRLKATGEKVSEHIPQQWEQPSADYGFTSHVLERGSGMEDLQNMGPSHIKLPYQSGSDLQWMSFEQNLNVETLKEQAMTQLSKSRSL